MTQHLSTGIISFKITIDITIYIAMVSRVVCSIHFRETRQCYCLRKGCWEWRGGDKLHNALLHDTALATIYIMSLQRGKNTTMTTAGVAWKGRESCNVTTSAFPR